MNSNWKEYLLGIAFLALIFFGIFLSDWKLKQPCEVERIDYIRAIEFEGSLEGEFYVTYSVIKNRPTYSYYKITKDGDYFLDNVPTSIAVVREDIVEVEQPYIATMKNSLCASPEELKTRNLRDNWYIFHIPKGGLINH
jgi:hypothetical protein